MTLTTPQTRWTALTGHRHWLHGQGARLLDFFGGAVDPDGGFRALATDGAPMPGPPLRQLHSSARMVHCYSIATLMGRPGASDIVDHGLDFLWRGHRDARHGGYHWSIGADGPVDATKQAYGHAFVLLAASSAKVAGHPDADRLLADVTQILHARFWDEAAGATREEFAADWSPLEGGAYRGQNSNMHLTEALMAAFEATGDAHYLQMAERIADLIVNRHARAMGWRLPEHFHSDWTLDKNYSGSPMFRPFGTTPGHWLEWARLLVQLHELGGRRLDWAVGASRALFMQAVNEGWDKEKGGFYYTLEWTGAPRIRDRYWWPCAEGIGAAHALGEATGEAVFEDWYRRIWDFCAAHLIDAEHGGWHPQLDENLRPNSDPFFGKPDIYHALQACLIPLLPLTGSVTRGLVTTGLHLEGRLAPAVFGLQPGDAVRAVSPLEYDLTVTRDEDDLIVCRMHGDGRAVRHGERGAHRRPVGAAVGRFPDAPGGRREVERVRVGRAERQPCSPSSERGADRPIVVRIGNIEALGASVFPDSVGRESRRRD